jgi:hypothetical protein
MGDVSPWPTLRGIALRTGLYSLVACVRRCWVTWSSLQYTSPPLVHIADFGLRSALKINVNISVIMQISFKLINSLRSTVPLECFLTKGNILEREYPSRSK